MKWHKTFCDEFMRYDKQDPCQFDEKNLSQPCQTSFHSSDWWARSLSTDVSGRSFEVIDKYELQTYPYCYTNT
jgi:hypothetical protein